MQWGRVRSLARTLNGILANARHRRIGCAGRHPTQCQVLAPDWVTAPPTRKQYQKPQMRIRTQTADAPVPADGWRAAASIVDERSALTARTLSRSYATVMASSEASASPNNAAAACSSVRAAQQCAACSVSHASVRCPCATVKRVPLSSAQPTLPTYSATRLAQGKNYGSASRDDTEARRSHGGGESGRCVRRAGDG